MSDDSSDLTYSVIKTRPFNQFGKDSNGSERRKCSFLQQSTVLYILFKYAKISFERKKKIRI